MTDQWKKQNEDVDTIYRILTDEDSAPTVRSRFLSEFLAERFAEIRCRLTALHQKLNAPAACGESKAKCSRCDGSGKIRDSRPEYAGFRYCDECNTAEVPSDPTAGLEPSLDDIGRRLRSQLQDDVVRTGRAISELGTTDLGRAACNVTSDLRNMLYGRIRSLESELANERQRHQEHLDISAQRFNRIRELREQNDRLLAWKESAMLELGKWDKVRDAATAAGAKLGASLQDEVIGLLEIVKRLRAIG